MRFGNEDSGISIAMESGVADVRLDRPAKLNSLTHDLMAAIRDTLDFLGSQSDLRCVVLSGEGRSFCSGMDVSVLSGGEIAPLSPRTHGIANGLQYCTWGWRELDVPVIAAIHGHCYGGGLQIAMGADVRIATPEARLSIMEIRHGLVPDMGLFALARGLVRDDRLRELVYTAREFSGEDAAEFGLVTCTDAEPRKAALALAAQIANSSAAAIAAAKRLIGQMQQSSAAELLQFESDEQEAILSATMARG